MTALKTMRGYLDADVNGEICDDEGEGNRHVGEYLGTGDGDLGGGVAEN